MGEFFDESPNFAFGEGILWQNPEDVQAITNYSQSLEQLMPEQLERFIPLTDGSSSEEILIRVNDTSSMGVEAWIETVSDCMDPDEGWLLIYDCYAVANAKLQHYQLILGEEELRSFCEQFEDIPQLYELLRIDSDYIASDMFRRESMQLATRGSTDRLRNDLELFVEVI